MLIIGEMKQITATSMEKGGLEENVVKKFKCVFQMSAEREKEKLCLTKQEWKGKNKKKSWSINTETMREKRNAQKCKRNSEIRKI